MSKQEDGAGDPRRAVPGDRAGGTAGAADPRRAVPGDRAGGTAGAADPRRAVPRVDALTAHPGVAALAEAGGPAPVRSAVRAVLDDAREGALAGGPVPDLDQLAGSVAAALADRRACRTRRVLNATGVVLHTNLGRAPLSPEARSAVAEAAGYGTVEYDLATGRRGRRGAYAERLLAELTGAPTALVVNNAAAGLLLALGCLARGREVLVSRGELIEIGGEFRLPDVMAAAGATLVEVGTTNRTRVSDFATAVSERTALVLAVHPSNYRITGFTSAPDLAGLARLAHESNLPLLHDIGSGLVRGSFGDEPTVARSLEAGADLVLFSGDKLLGGPQAGCLVGRADLVRRLARDPLARPVRADKLTIAALEATLEAHLAGRRDELPVWQSLGATPAALRVRTEAIAEALGPAATVIDGLGVAGGGSLPGEALPGPVIEIAPTPASADGLLEVLRQGDPPVVARIERGSVLVDLRAIPPEEDRELLGALRAAIAASR